MEEFKPQSLFIDTRVAHFPVVKRVLSLWPHLKPNFVDDLSFLKQAIPHSEAKKKLLITRFDGSVVKPCQGFGDYVCCNYLTVSLISNCHFECSYCILQDYLKNNPIMTFYANHHEILAQVEKFLDERPQQIWRVGTGELADSLALDPITDFSRECIALAARKQNMILELKTKSNCVDHLLKLPHHNKTVLSWSLNPKEHVKKEEHKTANLDERLAAARKAANAGYWIAFHLDPLMHLEGWKKNYEELLIQLADEFCSEEIAWISMGSLRYTSGLENIARERFPKSELFLGELFKSPDGKIRYLREIREELYTYVKNLVEKNFPTVPNYLCMETNKVWERIYGRTSTQGEIEKHLNERFG
ncbi:MAG: hypothetical protein A3G32_07020 [Deltaproteobacteria bacterium RIFCSPLOWO2_12_FULL_40_28]|nr:MAG: hypothetical protein A3C45_07065 [Deltaproteobacteria bacterium RIFCSPHIGHO2_02_FULL_40_28]OGQ19292.1 MAG: hypothetical protein A3E27_04750 [Deltaproteobacteria bacterium RIFCSPHIGHO2_12_FULL_40_32]OGQ40484.1 MAG: hypothetical protein A3I69_00320 [Deltaproteobacteria bacterium RIFCSPLOWO2_02_FULL_40_36]OGQ53720.1 MAG: hypothetical protein A3G32_07020 [Deltaproteobacteria bacterium RIFCSPLOWO2_12_FULL_40_28]